MVFLAIPFAAEQNTWGGAFLSLIRKKGCELLLATLDGTPIEDRAALSLTYAELFIWSDGHFFLETLKRLPQDQRIFFATQVFNLPSAKRELKSVENFWSIIFLAEAVYFLSETDAKTFKDNLSAALNHQYLDGKGWETLSRGATLTLPSPSPEYLIGALHCIENTQARLAFAKNLLTVCNYEVVLYKKPTLEFLIKVLLALEPAQYQEFIVHFIQHTPLTAAEIAQAQAMTAAQAQQLLWGDVQSPVEIPTNILSIATAIKTHFVNIDFNTQPQPTDLPKAGPNDFRRVQAAHLYVAKLSRLKTEKEKVAFAKKHADVLIWTEPQFFLDTMALLPATAHLAFLKHTFNLGTAELADCKTPWSIVALLTAVAELPPKEQQQAIEDLTAKTRDIEWRKVVQKVLKREFPETPSAECLIGLLYLLPANQRLSAAQEMLHVLPPPNMWVWHEKPSVSFLQGVLKALLPNEHAVYIQRFKQIMGNRLTATELLEMNRLPERAAIPATQPARPAATHPEPIAQHAQPSVEPQATNFNGIMIEVLNDYIATQKATWQYRWADKQLSPLPGFLRKAFNFLFKRHQKVDRAEAALCKFIDNQTPDAAMSSLQNQPFSAVTKQLKPGIFVGFSRGLLEKKIEAKLGITAAPKPHVS